MAPKTEHQFSVTLADLEQDDQHLKLSIPAGWLAGALSGTEARSCGADGMLDVVVSKSGRDVLVRGQLRARVEMDCSRSLEPFELPIETDVFLMLAPAAAEASPRRRPARAGSKPGSAEPQAGGAKLTGSGKSAGSAKAVDAAKAAKSKKPKHESDEEEALSDEDAARDVYSGDEVILDGFIREFILLELPLFPLRSEDTPHIAPPSQEPAAGDRPLDPRLAPLAALRDRLRNKE